VSVDDDDDDDDNKETHEAISHTNMQLSGH
jgi:hypothetical protein